MFALSKVMIFVAIIISSLLYWATSNVCRYNFTIERKTNNLNVIASDMVNPRKLTQIKPFIRSF